MTHALSRLGGRHAAQLEAVLFGDVPDRPRYWMLFPVLTVLSVILLALGFVWPQAIAMWIGLCAVNMLAQMLYRPRVKEFVPAMREIPTFIDACQSVGAMSIPGLTAETAVARDGAERLRGVRVTTAWLRWDGGLANEVAGSLYEYANLLFLLDLTSFVLTTSSLQTERTTAQAMFRAIGTIDAVQAIAAWRASLSVWSSPQFTDRGKAATVEALVHPLLPAGVPNALDVGGTSVLITGSNMSGKTTFLRAVGVNAVLAQAVGTVCAATWRAPLLRIRTSIGQQDSLLDGKSYYLAEVESVRRMLVAKEDGEQYLFLIDELFRGTNTPERVAASYATLAWLTRGDHLVFVATHDIELHERLGNSYAVYHFREHVADNGLTFDFLMRPGVSSTRNAIALLRMTGFPEALVTNAERALAESTR